MSRAYIRLDPGFDEHKYDYPDGAYAALVATLCHAEGRFPRGWFRSEAHLRRLLGKRARWVPYLIEKGDLIREGDQLYVDGWTEWQEGDVTVKERMTRLRSRRHHVTVDVTADRTNAAGRGEAISAAQGGDGAEPKNLRRFPPCGSRR